MITSPFATQVNVTAFDVLTFADDALFSHVVQERNQVAMHVARVLKRRAITLALAVLFVRIHLVKAISHQKTLHI